jgi:hypothetical protein
MTKLSSDNKGYISLSNSLRNQIKSDPSQGACEELDYLYEKYGTHSARSMIRSGLTCEAEEGIGREFPEWNPSPR